MSNPMTLEGKSILVTGAGQGIGRAIATAILELGGRVVAIDRNPETLDELRREARSDRLTVAVGDVCNADFVTNTVNDAYRASGRIDGLVNNAGITRPAMIHKMEMDTWTSVMDVNLTAPFRFLHRGCSQDDQAEKGCNIPSRSGDRLQKAQRGPVEIHLQNICSKITIAYRNKRDLLPAILI